MTTIDKELHTTQMVVPRAWLDYNEHMNVAYYTVAFDLASEELLKAAGMGGAYTEATQNSSMAVEAHITYQNEARLGDALTIKSRVLACASKAAHLYQEMFRGEQLLATEEQLVLHVSLVTRGATPFEPAVLAALQAMQAMQQEIPRPDWVGRQIAIRRS
ncbi:MAG: thioesterase-like protein [Gammaproteobacteria bacterium]|nr:thioesterase-like protein [Gammaproteobacteria bacterium]